MSQYMIKKPIKTMMMYLKTKSVPNMLVLLMLMIVIKLIIETPRKIIDINEQKFSDPNTCSTNLVDKQLVIKTMDYLKANGIVMGFNSKVHGQASSDDMESLILYTLLSDICNRLTQTIIEIGTYQGKSMVIIGVTILINKLNKRLITYDVERHASVQKSIMNFKLQNIVEARIGRFYDHDHESIAMFYEDDGHTFPSTTSSTFYFLPKISIHGLLLYHDSYCTSGAEVESTLSIISTLDGIEEVAFDTFDDDDMCPPTICSNSVDAVQNSNCRNIRTFIKRHDMFRRDRQYHMVRAYGKRSDGLTSRSENDSNGPKILDTTAIT